eukprot:130806-Chlamydomonas_euryale.AAC.3
MLIDVMTDRGFKISHTAEVAHVPMHVDLKTGSVKSRTHTKHRFLVNWDTTSIREKERALDEARMSESAASVRISQSFVPKKPTLPPPQQSAAYMPPPAAPRDQ